MLGSADASTKAAADVIRSRTDRVPMVAMILGSGLGGLADQIEHPTCIPFSEIPGFGTSTASGHRGQLIIGELEATTIVAMAGRFHRYEGWSNDQVAFPVRVMASLGAGTLIVSNAAGGVSPKLAVGDLVVIRDHINWMGGHGSRAGESGASESPSLEQGHFEFGPQRSENVYDDELAESSRRVGMEKGFNVHWGTYLATLGPNYESRSEYRMMRRMGADVVGMSTIPEVLAANLVNMRVLGLSMVSNVANPDQPVKADHAEVLEAGRSAAVKLEQIVRAVIRGLPT
ncbi:MAG: purine-nucleoside phosphorylase [Rubripirellula sp.]